MKHLIRLVLGTLVIVTLVSPSVFAATKFTVAVVDSGRILQEYPAAQKMFQELTKAEAELNKKVLEKKQILDKAKAENKSEAELQMLTEQIKLELEPQAKKLEEESNAKSAEIEKKVNDTIKATAAASKYDLVLVKEAVLYGANDITNEILKKLK